MPGAIDPAAGDHAAAFLLSRHPDGARPIGKAQGEFAAEAQAEVQSEIQAEANAMAEAEIVANGLAIFASGFALAVFSQSQAELQRLNSQAETQLRELNEEEG